jgi:hypothetical protein
MNCKKQNHKIPIKVESANYDNEAINIEGDKEYTEKDLPPWYEDMLYEEWRDMQVPMKDNKDNR